VCKLSALSMFVFFRPQLRRRSPVGHVCFIVLLFCTQAATSPGLLSMSKYLVAIFWIGAIVTGWYVGEELLRIYRKKQAEKQAKLRSDMAAAEAEAEARGEDKALADEPLSPGAQSPEGKDDGDDDLDEEDEEDEEDGPSKKK
jgi:flagellar biosynthesis/type III secretory pathway M-ring protein FliF/YscJ